MSDEVSPVSISAIVLSFNSNQYITTCVEKTLAAYKEADLEGEIIVFENGSKDGSVETLEALQAKHGDKLNVIYAAQNRGTTVSRNAAIAASRGEYLLVLDSDAYIDGSSLQALRQVLVEQPECGIVVPKIFYPSGRVQLSIDRFPTLGRKIQRFFGLKQIESQAEAVLPSELQAVDYAISALWLVPRKIVAELGAFDERIFYSPEDVDFCLRVWLGGYSILYEPRAEAIHDAQEISRRGLFNVFTLRHAMGLMYYFAKHNYIFGTARLRKRIRLASDARLRNSRQ